MKYKITLLFIVLTTLCSAQVVTIPDLNFKNALLTSLCVDADLNGSYESDADINNDGQIQTSEASVIQRLKISGKSISDLTGIQSFANLKIILCNNNLLTTINFSSNLSLQQIDCYSNNFVSLTINGLPLLNSLNIYPNSLLQNLTVTNNPSLTTLALDSGYGSLSSLVNLDCSHNALTGLGFNNSSYPFTNLINVNCSFNNLTGLYPSTIVQTLNASNNHITQFSLQSSNVTTLDISNNNLTGLGIWNSGNLSTLDFSGNPLITNLSLTNTNLINLSVSNLSNLQYLDCSFNASYGGTKLSTLTVSNLPSLLSLNCSNNVLTNLNIINFPNLTTFNANENPAINLVLSNLPGITSLNLNLTANSVNINTMSNLTSLIFNYSQIKNISVDSNPILNQLSYVQPFVYDQFLLTNLPSLATINFFCHKASAFNLNISSLPALTSLKLDINDYCNLNMASLPLLNFIEIKTATMINIHDLPQLHTIKSEWGDLVNLSLVNLPNLYELLLSHNSITALVLENLPNLHNVNVESNNISNLILTNLPSLYDLNLSYNNTSVTGSTYNFTNLPQLYNLNLNHSNSPAFINLNALPNLHDFNLSSNPKITGLNFNNLPNLYICQVGSCSNLASLTLTNLNNLYKLVGYNTKIAAISLTNLPNLYDISLTTNNFLGNNITLNSLPNLNKLDLTSNKITSLTLTALTNLYDFNISNNSFLQNLNLISLQSLNKLTISGCTYNLINLDLSSCPNIMKLIYQSSYYDKLKYINLKNGNSNFTTLTIGHSVRTICVDNNAEAIFLHSLTPTLNNIIYTTYCTFNPGGTFYTIQGNSRFDYNTNGCDSNDLTYPFMNFNVVAGTISNSFYANNTSSYSVALIGGTYTITPVFENPTYYTVSPSSASVTFPTSISPFIQDFCVTANGTHHDLETVLLPINAARPGFDVKYKIVYKNKGTTTQSGVVNLAFDDAILDLVTANPIIASQTTNSLTWDFTNLAPFESREILVTLNVNSPTETPAVNSGAILNYTTSVMGATDETPNDNTATLNQTVVNAFDPNDKTCLQGASVSPVMVGQYAHYIIRFENNGTANAQNIVVKDIIDINKFDIASLISIQGSHLFETRVTNSNTVEFIFQNINLPFANANNDGYIAFKIKIKSNLITGDTFSNSANIYFDYNAPIGTNNYVTTIQTLGINEISGINKLSVYPNPVNDILFFNTVENVTKVEVYDITGRILSSNAVNENKVNLSGLKTGNYILKVYTESGIINTKIIKE